MSGTICALSSAPGRAGVAVVRLSGPQSFEIAEQIAGTLPKPGHHGVRVLTDHDGTVIDEALVLCFAGPRSFTGEDVVEFQTHGSPAVVAGLLNRLVALGADMAEAGAFTRQALMNEKLGLTEVEGLADLLSAETRAQLDQAQRVFTGQLRELAEELRTDLLRAAALTEAMIDFADEELPEDVTDEVRELISAVSARISAEVAGSLVAERVRDGFEVAIVGAPNAGKSTLLNWIAGRDAALVSDIAGTTRDILEVRTELNGLAVTWLDTAGLRESEDRVEKMGVARAVDRALAADLRVFLLDRPGQELPIPTQPDDLILLGKSDISGGDISGHTGDGVEKLMAHVGDVLSLRVARVGTATNIRHRSALQSAHHSLESAATRLENEGDLLDMVAEDLRQAIRHLEVLVGRMDVEMILGEIFSSFCIGK